jgi:signal transduction histidine kinase
MGFQAPLWRAIAVFRVAALAYPAVLVAVHLPRLESPLACVLAVAAMAVWTAVSVYAYAAPQRRRWPLLATDLLVTAGCLVAIAWGAGAAARAAGVPALPGPWMGGPVLAWAVSGGRRRGTAAAVLLGGAEVAARRGMYPSTFTGLVIMLLAGVVVGHVVRLAADADERLRRAVELDAATRERERLARSIHDSVLQVLALVQRRGQEIGGEAAELGRLAGQQEAALRALVTTQAAPATADGPTDLRTLLSRCASADVSVVTPATPVPVPAPLAAELAAAVGSALDNVARHCPAGTRAWVLVEDEDGLVTVTVRDDGPGIPAGRLAAAAAAGRMGVAQSICGRIRDAGGAVTVTSSPGEGTEVEMRVRRSASGEVAR